MQLLIMSMTIFICLTFLSIACADHAVIGDYSKLINGTYCGITRSSVHEPGGRDCFKWNKDAVPKLRLARNATAGEAPWTVYIQLTNNTNSQNTCTGTLIQTQWVLTVAHCINSTFLYTKVYFGNNFTTDNLTNVPYREGTHWYKHPDYIPHAKENDLALIHLKSGPDPIWKNNYMEVNTICLPERGIANFKNYEFGIIAGHGKVLSNLFPWGLPLQMSNVKLRPYEVLPGKMFLYNTVDIVHHTCPDDDGAPIWQFYMGRAVLIGMHVRCEDGTSYNKCYIDDGYIAKFYAERISMHIDWILDTLYKHWNSTI